MTIKRYIFNSGLDIIAPPKCGTRWLECFDVEERISRTCFHISEISKNINSNTTFIWRPVREHFLSALQTDLNMNEDFEPIDIINQMEAGEGMHWNPTLYKEVYHIWKETGFTFYKLRALSKITPTAYKHRYISKEHIFELPNKWNSISEVLDSLSYEDNVRVEKMITDEEGWLEKMIFTQYTNKSWNEYSDLEDSLFQAECKIMDMDAEIKSITESKLFKKLQSKIYKLKTDNIRLQANLKYFEDKFGSNIKKLL